LYGSFSWVKKKRNHDTPERGREIKMKSIQNVIPQGELRCVWMDAGITEFKLCDQEFRCETCKFNGTIQEKQGTHAGSHEKDMVEVHVQEKAMTAEECFKKTLQSHLKNLRTVEIPMDRMYNHNHYWIQEYEPGTHRIGINHILADFLRPLLSIVVSKAPFNISKNDPFCWMILPGGAVTLRSPIDATIKKFNPALQQKPNMLCTSPFSEGWIMEISVKAKGLNGFSSASESHPRFERVLHNIDHSFIHAFRHHNPSAGTTLFDGGIAIENIESVLGPKIYLDVVNRIVHLPS
jgi:glycine cleavage system H protein